MKARLTAKTVQDWVSQASFVFRGRIKALGKSNLEGVPPDERMATVQVQEVVVAPPDLGDLTGKAVTVYLTSRQGLRAGRTTTFFARNWHLGRTVGVVEIGRTDAPTTDVRQHVGKAQLQQIDARLEERLRGARLIVSAKVLTVARMDSGEMPGVDDGVEWWEAEMFVRSVEKGAPPPDLRCIFPVGGDYEWAAVPKCQPDQEGIWLLRTIEDVRKAKHGARKARRASAASEEYWIAFDPLDYQSLSALPRIQAMLWRAGKRRR